MKLINTRIRYFLFALICIATLHFNLPVRVIGIINMMSLIVLGNAIKNKQGKLLSPFLLIAICLYVFNCGHLWLSVFSLSPSRLLMDFGKYYKTFDINIIIEVYKEITYLLIVFMLTGLVAVKPISMFSNKHFDISIEMSQAFRFVFLILYAISMYLEFKRSSSVAALSYAEGYHYSTVTAIYLVSLVNILLFFFLFLYQDNPKKFKFYLLLQIIRSLFIIMFVGNRGTSVINLLLTFFILATYSYLSYDSKKIRNILVALLVFFVIAMPFVSSTRGTSDAVGMQEFLNNNNPIENFLEEFGGTVQNVFLAKEYCSGHMPSYGFQIFATTLSIFPGSTILFGDIITSQVSIGSLFNELYNIQGLGGSMLAQLYFNFDYSVWLFISVILSALLISWVSNKLMNEKLGLYSSLVFLCLFSGLLTWVRGEWYEVIGDLKMGLYVMFVIYLFRGSILIQKERS